MSDVLINRRLDLSWTQVVYQKLREFESLERPIENLVIMFKEYQGNK